MPTDPVPVPPAHTANTGAAAAKNAAAHKNAGHKHEP
jgi:hypothetical protein